jgi:hypothetical protein
MTSMRFHSWQRSSLMDNATGQGVPRLSGSIPLKLDDVADNADPRDVSIPVLFRGPADVKALKPTAIRHMAPRPATADAETTKFVHIDFNEPDLPWRYSPVGPDSGDSTRLKPWIVLLVGTAEELDVQGNMVVPSADVLNSHPLADSYRWAHVHEQDGASISRLVSPRMLAPLRSHVAAVVPAFDAQGNAAWQNGQLTGSYLPVFHSWRFQTGEQGDFETLAAALRVRRTGSLGIASIRYNRPLGHVDVSLKAGGAITSLQDLPNQADAVKAARLDLDGVNNDLHDEVDPAARPQPPMRKIIPLPDYGGLWLEDTDAVQWSKSMNEDPRHRGVAGLGLEMGVIGQEALMGAAVEQAGALQDIGQRIAFLAMGLGMSGRLWERRLPEDAESRLRVFGPAMSRMPSDRGGTVLDYVTSDRSVLARSLFSSAAMRLTRNGTARSRLSGKGRIDRAAVLTAANKPQAGSPDVVAGLPHVDEIARKMGKQTLGELMKLPELDGRAEELIRKFEGQRRSQDNIAYFIKLADEMLGLKCAEFMNLYFNTRPSTIYLERDLLVGAFNACRGGKRWFEQIDLMPPFVPPNSRDPVNLGPLSNAVTKAIDPTGKMPPARARVAGTIEGLDLISLAPPEAPIGLDYPTWTLLKNNEPEWLLPGVGDLQSDSIVALRTNPAFIDAFMVGINSQFLAEMRWRNLPAPRVSTPLRMFWGYVDYASGKREADIQPLDKWPSREPGAANADDIGALSHQAFKSGDATGKTDLVIAFRTALFRRYPSTLVYLVRPPSGLSTVDKIKWKTDIPDLKKRSARLTEAALDKLLTDPPNFEESPTDRSERRYFGPIFQGEIMPDLVFFAFDVDPSTLDQYWLVLDEPPAELRFRNDRNPDDQNAANFAVETIDHPTRVAISGSALEALGENP